MNAPTLTDLIFIKRGFLSEKDCKINIDEYENINDSPELEHCPHAGTGVDTWSSYSIKSPVFGGEAFSLIHKSIEKMVCDYNDYLDTFNSFHIKLRAALLYPHKYRIMKYDKGAKIHPHSDHDVGVYGSCTINLNDEYTGGDFLFWNGKHKVKLEKGDAMIWPGDYFWVHELDDIKSGSRYSVNCFIRKTPQFLPEEIKYNVPAPSFVKNKREEIFGFTYDNDGKIINKNSKIEKKKKFLWW